MLACRGVDRHPTYFVKQPRAGSYPAHQAGVQRRHPIGRKFERALDAAIQGGRGGQKLRLRPLSPEFPRSPFSAEVNCTSSSSAASTATAATPKPTTKEQAHVQPRFPEAWRSSANPVRSYTLLNHESPEFIRFVNPGDLRIAHLSCGTDCHPNEVLQNRMSMMTHGCMLWGAALYNNGSFPLKQARFGESYSMNGAPQRLQTVPPPTE